jgi:hypothetical protein
VFVLQTVIVVTFVAGQMAANPNNSANFFLPMFVLSQVLTALYYIACDNTLIFKGLFKRTIKTLSLDVAQQY